MSVSVWTAGVVCDHGRPIPGKCKDCEAVLALIAQRDKAEARAAELERSRDDLLGDFMAIEGAMPDESPEQNRLLLDRVRALVTERDHWRHHAEKLEAKGETIMSHKGEIAALKKQIAGLEKQVAYWKGDGMERRSKARRLKKAEWNTLVALRDREAAGRDALGDAAKAFMRLCEKHFGDWWMAAERREVMANLIDALAEWQVARKGGDHG